MKCRLSDRIESLESISFWISTLIVKVTMKKLDVLIRCNKFKRAILSCWQTVCVPSKEILRRFLDSRSDARECTRIPFYE